MILLEAQNYRTHKKLELEIPINQLTVFVGANGSGKSSAMQALQHPIFGETYYIEAGKKARPNELIRHGESGLYVAVTFPTFKSEIEYESGALTRTVHINGVKVDSDRNDQHHEKLLLHIGANQFADLPAAIKRFCYISPSSKNVYTIGDSERKAYLLERNNDPKIEEVKEVYGKSQKKFNSNGDKIKALEQHKVEGVETETRFLKEDIAGLEKLVEGKLHYSQLGLARKALKVYQDQLENLMLDSLELEARFGQEQVPVLTEILRLNAESQGDLIERSLCEEQVKQLELKFKLINNDIDKIEKEIAKPLRCKKCGQMHYSAHGDIFAFEQGQVEDHLRGLKSERNAKALELNSYSWDKTKWQLRDALAKEREKLETLKANQQIRRENNEKEITRLRAEIEKGKALVIEAETYEAQYKELEALRDKLKLAEADNLIIAQEKKRRVQTATLKNECLTLSFLTKRGIPEIIHEAVVQPLTNLMAEINKSFRALDLDLEALFELSRNGSDLPSGIELPILVNGKKETYTTINSQGLQGCIAYASLIAEFEAFGSPFQNICGLTLFDDPLLGLGDLGKLDLKSRLAQAIGQTTYGTRVVAVPDENVVRLMNPARVYYFEIEDGESKVRRL